MTAIDDVIIIGSGPAGYTAALHTARAQLKPLAFECSVTADGALMNTPPTWRAAGPDGARQPPAGLTGRRQQQPSSDNR